MTEVKNIFDLKLELKNAEDIKKIAALYRSPFSKEKACELFNVHFMSSGLCAYNGEIYFSYREMICVNTTKCSPRDKYFPLPTTIGEFICYSIAAGIALYWKKEPLLCRL